MNIQVNKKFEMKFVLKEEHFIATFLTPKFKHLKMLPDEKKMQVHEIVRNHLKKLTTDDVSVVVNDADNDETILNHYLKKANSVNGKIAKIWQ